MKIMKILITGGTGAMGNQLISELLKKNHKITMITRNKSKVKNNWKDQVNLVEADPSIEVVKLFNSVDCVIFPKFNNYLIEFFLFHPFN